MIIYGSGFNISLYMINLPILETISLTCLALIAFAANSVVCRLALVSGCITSGIGYTIWYIALTGLTSTQAAVVQLSVPVIAATGGVIFVEETITSRLVISACLVLGGILMVVLGKYSASKKQAIS